MSRISTSALKRLQTLYHQFERRSFDLSSSREDRLAWAAQCLGKSVTSFSTLSADDGKYLIDSLQLSMRINETAPPRRRRMSQHAAQKAGTEGRRDQIHSETTMLAGDEEILTKIMRELSSLGWTEERFKAWLRSSSSPNKGRDTIRTLGDANKIHWALKRMAERNTQRGVAA